MNQSCPGQGGEDAADQIRAIARLRCQRLIPGRRHPGQATQGAQPGATYISPLWGFSLRLRRQIGIVHR